MSRFAPAGCDPNDCMDSERWSHGLHTTFLLPSRLKVPGRLSALAVRPERGAGKRPSSRSVCSPVHPAVGSFSSPRPTNELRVSRWDRFVPLSLSLRGKLFFGADISCSKEGRREKEQLWRRIERTNERTNEQAAREEEQLEKRRRRMAARRTPDGQLSAAS